jgi:hypothetical protein
MTCPVQDVGPSCDLPSTRSAILASSCRRRVGPAMAGASTAARVASRARMSVDGHPLNRRRSKNAIFNKKLLKVLKVMSEL